MISCIISNMVYTSQIIAPRRAKLVTEIMFDGDLQLIPVGPNQCRWSSSSIRTTVYRCLYDVDVREARRRLLMP